MFDNLELLCELNGASGREDKIREFIIEQIRDNAGYSVDKLGNIIAFKKGMKKPKNKIMIDAHMDEVAFIITAIMPDGTLKFDTIGGIDLSVAAGRQVTVGECGLSGVIGTKAVHNLSEEEKQNVPTADMLFIDIGASSKEQAQKHVSLGDCAYFKTKYTEYNKDIIMAKAIDDRFGCALLIDMINSEIMYDAYFTFTVQEEIGLRGAKTAAYAINPDIAIVVEATTAADIDNVSEAKKVCRLGKGAVVSFMDGGTIYDKDLYNLAFDLAEEKGIKCQTKARIAGGNNSGVITCARDGVKTISVSAPCRYLHSPSSMVNRKDIMSCHQLIYALTEKAAEIEL